MDALTDVRNSCKKNSMPKTPKVRVPITVGALEIGSIYESSSSWGGNDCEGRAIYPRTTQHEMVLEVVVAWVREHEGYEDLRLVWGEPA